MSKPTVSEFYEHCKMRFCMGCQDKGEEEENCDDCPADVPFESDEEDSNKAKTPS